MNVNERLKYIRNKKNVSLSELSKMTGIAKSTLQRYETGNTKKIPLDAITAIEKALFLSTGYLMGWNSASDDTDIYKYDNISPIKTKKIPLLGEIACGEPIMCEQDFESYVEAGAEINADFCLKAKGDSMVNARILDGDIVFIRKQDMVDNGEIAAVVIDNEATLKRVYYYKAENKLVLMSENPKYSPYVYINEELDEIHILGKAIAFQSDIKMQ